MSPRSKRSNTRIHTSRLTEEGQRIIEKYVPRMMDAIAVDVSGPETVKSILEMTMASQWEVPDAAKIWAFHTEGTFGIEFFMAGISFHADTPDRVTTLSGEMRLNTPSRASYPYSAFGFTPDEIREITGLMVEIASTLPVNQTTSKKKRMIQEDSTYEAGRFSLPRQHRILIEHEALSAYKAMVQL